MEKAEVVRKLILEAWVWGDIVKLNQAFYFLACLKKTKTILAVTAIGFLAVEIDIWGMLDHDKRKEMGKIEREWRASAGSKYQGDVNKPFASLPNNKFKRKYLEFVEWLLTVTDHTVDLVIAKIAAMKLYLIFEYPEKRRRQLHRTCM